MPTPLNTQHQSNSEFGLTFEINPAFALKVLNIETNFTITAQSKRSDSNTIDI